MSYMLVTMALASLRLPIAETFKATDWQPVFTEPAELDFKESTLALVTHASLRFDPLGQTRDGLCKTVATMKASNFPVIYLHDKYNPSNPPWMYLYDDWTPTAYVSSDVGNVTLNIEHVEHVVCLGGFFGQCERSTVSDIIRCWYSAGLAHDFRVTQIVDATFTVAQHVEWEDSYRDAVRDLLYKQLKLRHPDAVLSVGQMLDRIVSFEQVVELLQRQLPQVPDDVNVAMDVFGRTITLQVVDPEAVTLTFSYRRSDDFLNQTQSKLDIDAPKRWLRATSFPKPIPKTVKPADGANVIVSPTQISGDNVPTFVPGPFIGPGTVIISD